MFINGYKNTEVKNVIDDLKINESNDIKIGNVQGHEIIITYGDRTRYPPPKNESDSSFGIDGLSKKELVQFFTFRNIDYTIMYSSERDKYSTYFPVIKKMLDTLNLGKSIVKKKISMNLQFG